MAITITDVQSLPIFPTSKTLKTLAPSLQATIFDNITTALSQALAVSEQQLSKLSCAVFISSYVLDGAIDVLNALVFPEEHISRKTSQEKEIHRLVLSLSQRLVGLPRAGDLDLRTLLDICILYGPKNTSKARKILDAAIKSNPTLLNDFEWLSIPTFTQALLSTESGLHALRKTLYCISSLIQCSPREVINVFSKNTDFILALATCYDIRLSVIAAGYGGINPDQPDETGTSGLWVQCKVAIIDIFHALLQNILNDVKENPRENADRSLNLVFSLLHLPSSSTQHDPSSEIPFLNRPLIVDYQEVYSLSSTLQSVLSNDDDPRLKDLSSTLQSFETHLDKTGAIKIILHSSGAAPTIKLQTHNSYSKAAETKSQLHSSSIAINDVDLEIATTSVMDILPDYEPSYVRSLLLLPQYERNPELVVAALLEGNAPPHGSASFSTSVTDKVNKPPLPPAEPAVERRNVFNDQVIDASRVNVGKKREETNLGDKAFIDQMKADILRRAAELSDSEEEEVEIDEFGKKVRIAAFEEEDDDLDNNVKVAGDGEATSDEEEPEALAEEDNIDTILELAYLNDPKVFDRDANTRRSKARVDLRTRTNWSDEQLEGWRIMLERNPKKDKILLKHEFVGNVKTGKVNKAGPSPSENEGEGNSTEQHGGRGRGRGGGGRGRGRGGRGGGQGDANDARARAWKDKNKSRQANHNRKRGHDRKMARGGAMPGPPA